MNTERGYTQLVTLAMSVTVCAVIGYALVKGFSGQAAAAQSGVVVEGGAPIDSLAPEALAPEVLSPEDIARDVFGRTDLERAGLVENEMDTEPIRPMLPDSTSVASPMLSEDDLREGYVELSFAKLANYQYVYPDPDDPKALGDQIPSSVRKLNKTKIVIQGFMLPVSLEKQRVTEFLLLKDQSACCFGVWPGLNEWIHVILPKGESVEHIADMPITVFGDLLVGEYYEKDVLLGIYRLEFHKLVGPR
jgi:hypothetical protein